MNIQAIVPFLLTSLAIATPASAYTISLVDGDLSDWGVSHHGNAADWNPAAGIFHTIEDQNTSFLSPGYGGQAYDAEAMYVTYDANNLYIAIATGHNPATPQNPSANSYGAGDIAIDMGNDGVWDYGIETTGNFGAAGTVYRNATWGYGLWPDTPTYDREAHPTSITAGTAVGSGTLATQGPMSGYGQYAGKHYFYEVAIPLSLFGSEWSGMDFKVHWTENCANDSIQVVATDFPHDNTVPEPGTLALLPLGLAGLMLLRRRVSAQ